jgi:hypothetical protein
MFGLKKDPAAILDVIEHKVGSALKDAKGKGQLEGDLSEVDDAFRKGKKQAAGEGYYAEPDASAPVPAPSGSKGTGGAHGVGGGTERPPGGGVARGGTADAGDGFKTKEPDLPPKAAADAAAKAPPAAGEAKVKAGGEPEKVPPTVGRQPSSAAPERPKAQRKRSPVPNVGSVSKEGIDSIEDYFRKTGFINDRANQEMLQRLRAGHRTPQDLRFYEHEMIESRLYKPGMDTEALREIHLETLRRQGIEYKRGYERELYAPEVVKNHPGEFPEPSK